MQVHQCQEIKYSINDIMNLDFDEQIIDLESYLKDFSIETEDGTSYGWINTTYEDLETSCFKRNLMGYGDIDCGTQDSFKTSVRKRRESFDPPFKRVYQDPTKVCFSPRLKPEWHRKHDYFTLDVSELLATFLKSPSGANSPVMKFHIHMKGQFMRSIGKEHLSLSKYELESHCQEPPFIRILTKGSRAEVGDRRGMVTRLKSGERLILDKDCFGSIIKFDISQVTLLQNRPDANTACNQKLKDEDFKILETIVTDKKLNCVPVFWNGLQKFSSEYPTCTKDEQYERIRELLVNFTGISDFVRSQFNPPCEELLIETSNQRIKGRKVETKYRTTKNMFGHVVVDRSTGQQNQYLDVEIRQLNNRYQMIKNYKEITIENCLSGIGGFIGMLIGLSLRQIPEIIGLMNNLFRRGNAKDNVRAIKRTRKI